MMACFADRLDAAEALIRALPPGIGPDWLVLALPRGGVPIAAAIARHLGADLDVILVRKVGAPGNRELALAAVTGPAPDQMVVNEAVRDMLAIDDEGLQALAAGPIREIEARRRRWCPEGRAFTIAGRDVLLVDDGVATGTTLAAALGAVRAQGARRIAVAVPVALGRALDPFRDHGVEIICPHPNAPFAGVGAAFATFPQVADDEVSRLLEKARQVPRTETNGNDEKGGPSG